ncbi:hypothetical protein RJ639_045567 [Escallonia herrerae]|uniref:Uncharacterized protein n=1 Tax=Escallonia herrerae TaxID=1293975 RepID=A0AA88W688_9ASTE|nr:hypothetical protein RJ639_045567 [Escallonia herrerae]
MLLRNVKPIRYLEAFGVSRKSPWLLETCSFSDIPSKKSKLAPLQERRMIDRRRLWAKGGDGGNGCTSFHRSRHDRRGRPDGGNGGRGGDVILECSPTLWDFSCLQQHVNAKKGGHGASKNKIGSRGADKVVLVPVGTVIHLVEGEIPSEVEKTSPTAVDPWDVPGELDCDLSESARHLASTVPGGTGVQAIADCCHGSSSSLKASLVKSAEVKQATQLSSIVPFSQSSPLCDRSRVCREDHNVWREDVSELDYGPSEADIDHGSCEADEETEEEENIQYNVAELVEPGQRIIVARGGDGGLGNVSTGKSHRSRSKPGAEKDKGVSSEESHDDQHPSPSAGFPGSEVVLLLELKSIADVGLVGVPNAGKSTLLGAISRAKPIVGHYAFTTLRPNLGNLNYDDFSLTVADIPGLIRGAHENRGLGHAFLRHIERTKVLAYVVDLAAALDDRKGIPPWEQLRDLILELEFYREGLSGRPSLIVANKIDEVGAEEVCDELKRRVPGIPIFPVCAVLEEGIPELKDGLRRLVNGEELYRLNLDCLVLD